MENNPVWLLKALMEEISERCWRAGWMDKLEYSLWDFLQKYRAEKPDEAPNSYDFGMGSIEMWEVAKMLQLAKTVGGWWIYVSVMPGEVGQAFIPLNDWRELFENSKLEKKGA